MRNASARPERSGSCCVGLGLDARVLVPFAALVAVLDWVTKRAVAESMPHGASEAVVGGFFNLVHVRNTGIAFSLFADSAPWFRDYVLPSVSFAAIVVIAAMFRGLRGMPASSRVALALVLAGAAGNLVERVRHGYVTDFLDFHVGSLHWPAFNVADSSITVGVCLLLLDSLRGRHGAPAAASAD